MKKAFGGLFVLLSLTAMLVLVGCGKEKTTPTQPGDPNSPTYELFSGEFKNVDSLVVQMFGNTFVLMDSITTSTPTSPRFRSPIASPAAVTWVWSEAVQSWICTASETTDSATVSIVDTIKFWQGATVVQWPNLNSLTQMTNHYWMTVSATGGDGGTAHLLTTVVFTGGIHRVLTIDASGAIDGSFDHTGTRNNDTTHCNGTMAFTVAADSLILDFDDLWNDSGLNCPMAGKLDFTGSVSLVCTGAGAGSVSGNWTVGETFDNGQMTLVYSNGTNSWTATETCGSEPFETGTDSAFVDHYFDGPDQFTIAFQTLDVSIALIDSVPAVGAPARSRKQASMLGDHEIIIISAVTSYTYSAGWHIFNFSALVVDTVLDDTTFVAGVDSLQIYSQTNLVQFPSGMDGVDQLRERMHAGWDQSSGVNWGRINHSSIVTATGVGADTTLSLSGTVHDTIYTDMGGEAGSCNITTVINETVSNLALPSANTLGCPLSGEVVVSAEFDAHCDAGELTTGPFDYHGTWTVNATVNPDLTITRTLTGGNFHWETTHECIQGASAPFWSGR